ncbi:Trm112 family protein [Acetobacteraceae bacterium]|nr:Trm112 family protein [Acetobacteraceae bacterium]
MSEEHTPLTRPVKPEQSLLDRLVCPVTHGPLEYNEETGELISQQAGLAFPVKDGIPLMMPDEARKL